MLGVTEGGVAEQGAQRRQAGVPAAVLAGDAAGAPKAGDATVEMIRPLRVARLNGDEGPRPAAGISMPHGPSPQRQCQHWRSWEAGRC